MKSASASMPSNIVIWSSTTAHHLVSKPRTEAPPSIGPSSQRQESDFERHGLTAQKSYTFMIQHCHTACCMPVI